MPQSKLVEIDGRIPHSKTYFSTAFYLTTSLLPYPNQLYFPKLSPNSKTKQNKTIPRYQKLTIKLYSQQRTNIYNISKNEKLPFRGVHRKGRKVSVGSQPVYKAEKGSLQRYRKSNTWFDPPHQGSMLETSFSSPSSTFHGNRLLLIPLTCLSQSIGLPKKENLRRISGRFRRFSRRRLV